MEWYDWKHRHKGLNGDSPADHYVKSLRRPTAEELELLLIHEEPRRSPGLAISVTMVSFIGFQMPTSAVEFGLCSKGKR